MLASINGEPLQRLVEEKITIDDALGTEFSYDENHGTCVNIDGMSLRDAFHYANMAASQRALWCSGYPGAEPNTCRYCGKHWRQWAGSKLDGHGACIVTDDFKARLAELLQSSPAITFAKVATAIGVSPAVVRSWTYPKKSHPEITPVILARTQLVHRLDLTIHGSFPRRAGTIVARSVHN